MTTTGSEWATRRLPLSALRLDWRNPRLPDEVQVADASQEELALYIDKHYDPLQIAASVARHGYFESEPLIAIMEGEQAVVVEGNRRLVALMGLDDSGLRTKFAEQNRGWAELPAQVALPENYPVVIVSERSSVVPLLGFRHISGIEPWEPWAQARFIADLVDTGQSLEAIAELVGRSITEVRSMYRDHEILKQASDEFRLDTRRAEESFGVFTAAMGRTKLRDYISAPAPRDVDPDYWPLPADAKPKVDKLLTYIFGDDRGGGRVVHDSRQLKDLADILADSAGTAERILDQSRSLEEAAKAIQETATQLKTYVGNVHRSLKLAAALEVTDLDAQTIRKLRESRRLIDQILGRSARSQESGS